LKLCIEEVLGEYEIGFRRVRSTMDNIFVVRNILEKFYEYNLTLCQLFTDFVQAYDGVKWKAGLD
jgi:hypothetical protein